MIYLMLSEEGSPCQFIDPPTDTDLERVVGHGFSLYRINSVGIEEFRCFYQKGATEFEWMWAAVEWGKKVQYPPDEPGGTPGPSCHMPIGGF